VASLATLSLSAGMAGGRGRHTRPDSGISGEVRYGPTCPVQRPGQNCTRPYRATIRIFREPANRLVGSPRSHRDGSFSVRLRPGRYRLVPEQGHPFPHASPQDLTVSAHRFSHVVINYDSGIR
jgi:hypothetical protein